MNSDAGYVVSYQQEDQEAGWIGQRFEIVEGGVELKKCDDT